jgi:rhamnose transport system permease protein
MKANILARLVTWENFLAALTLALLTYAAAAVPNFATSFNISQAIAGVSERALIVLPMALLIIAREIDLSVASTLALCSVIFGITVQSGASIEVSIVAALLMGAITGVFNGVMVTYLGLPSLVVTLGTLAMFRGVGYIILGSASVNVFPDAFTDFGIYNVGDSPIPLTIVPFLFLAPIFLIVLQFSFLGRRLYAIGGNPDVALYSGVKMARIRLGLFVVSGMVCGIASVVFTARLANARADNAIGMELDVITIALLGGVSVFGGRGKLTGVFWALILIAALHNVLGLSHFSGDAQGIITGLLLIAALLVNATAQRLQGAFQPWLYPSHSDGPSSGGSSVST